MCVCVCVLERMYRDIHVNRDRYNATEIEREKCVCEIEEGEKFKGCGIHQSLKLASSQQQQQQQQQ